MNRQQLMDQILITQQHIQALKPIFQNNFESQAEMDHLLMDLHAFEHEYELLELPEWLDDTIHRFLMMPASGRHSYTNGWINGLADAVMARYHPMHEEDEDLFPAVLDAVAYTFIEAGGYDA